MNQTITPDYSSFHQSFDDLYVQLDDANKFLITYLRESIPLEAGFGFFSILENIMYHIYFNKHRIYPSSAQLFSLSREYIGILFGEGKIKVKLVTPSEKSPIGKNKGGPQSIGYNSLNTVVYDNPNFLDILMHDMQSRYDMLSLVKSDSDYENKSDESDLVRMYCDHGVLISYDKNPFFDEL